MKLLEAIKEAVDFVKHNYKTFELLSAIKKDNHIQIKFDIGFLQQKIIIITIETKTTEIIKVDMEYNNEKNNL